MKAVFALVLLGFVASALSMPAKEASISESVSFEKLQGRQGRQVSIASANANAVALGGGGMYPGGYYPGSYYPGGYYPGYYGGGGAAIANANANAVAMG